METYGSSFVGFPELIFVRDLEYFEGPLLSEYKTSMGAVFVRTWVDCDLEKQLNRWLVIASTKQAVEGYLEMKVTLYELLTSSDVGFLIDTDTIGKPTEVRLVQITALPEDYLPARDAKHDVDLRPEP